MTKITEPDYSKYEGITKFALGMDEAIAGHSQSLEDQLVFAYTDHIRKQGKEKDALQGAGLGEALYDSARNYVKGTYFNGKLDDNNLEDLVDEVTKKVVGASRAELSGKFSKQKEVHINDLKKDIEKAKEGMKKYHGSKFETKLERLGDDDYKDFTGYVTKLAKEVGLTEINPSAMPDIETARGMYAQVVLPRYIQKIRNDKANQELNENLKKNKPKKE